MHGLVLFFSFGLDFYAFCKHIIIDQTAKLFFEIQVTFLNDNRGTGFSLDLILLGHIIHSTKILDVEIILHLGHSLLLFPFDLHHTLLAHSFLNLLLNAGVFVEGILQRVLILDVLRRILHRVKDILQVRLVLLIHKVDVLQLLLKLENHKVS